MDVLQCVKHNAATRGQCCLRLMCGVLFLASVNQVMMSLR